MQIFENSNFDFMGKRKMCYAISAIIIVIGLISIMMNGGLKYNIDFEGGLSLEIAPHPIDKNIDYLTVDQVRDALVKNNITDAEIQEFPVSKSFLIRTKSSTRIGDTIVEIIKAEFPEHTKGENLIRSQEEVGPRAGADLRKKAVNAVLISLLFILAYVWIRFKFTWGIAAALALFHDTLITLSILSLAGKEIGMTVLAALLTIVGYSINDTIVVFDRIREDLKIYRKDDEYHVFNRSINEILGRTAITSFTTLLADMALLIFGGQVIHDFAFTLLIGIIVGTYSSIFIATAFIMDTVIATKKRSKSAVKK
jgi:preprotein translocase subunit SecF